MLDLESAHFQRVSGRQVADSLMASCASANASQVLAPSIEVSGWVGESKPVARGGYTGDQPLPQRLPVATPTANHA